MRNKVFDVSVTFLGRIPLGMRSSVETRSPNNPSTPLGVLSLTVIAIGDLWE